MVPPDPSDAAAARLWCETATQEDILAVLSGGGAHEWLGWRSPDGRSILHVAAKRHHAEVLKRLAELGQDMTEQDHSGDGALVYALHYLPEEAKDEEETVEYLLSLGLARPEHTQDQLMPIAKTLAERNWLSTKRSALEWIEFALGHGMPLLEPGGPMDEPPLWELLRKNHDQLTVALMQRGHVPLEDLKTALGAVERELLARDRDVPPLPGVRGILLSAEEGAELENATPQTSKARPQHRL